MNSILKERFILPSKLREYIPSVWDPCWSGAWLPVTLHPQTGGNGTWQLVTPHPQTGGREMKVGAIKLSPFQLVQEAQPMV